MTREQAWKKIVKLIGKDRNPCIDVRGAVSSPDRRQRASEALKFLKSRREELDAKIKARQEELLNVPDYQTMLAERKALREQADTLTGEAMHFKFLAGWSNSLFFHVEASGDTWEEVIAKLEAKKK